MLSKKHLKYSVVLAAVCLVIGFFLLSPIAWRRTNRSEAISLLTAANSTEELKAAIGRLGWFVSLTNNAWIAIRYRDSHYGSLRSIAIARDSGGQWFECDRHFCGKFSGWRTAKRLIKEIEEQRKQTSDGSNRDSELANSWKGWISFYQELIDVESAPDLEAARQALTKMGFKKLEQ